MVHLQIKNINLGIFVNGKLWYILCTFRIIKPVGVYFAIWYILYKSWYISSNFVLLCGKNVATLPKNIATTQFIGGRNSCGGGG
jgi:hypothetical protein